MIGDWIATKSTALVAVAISIAEWTCILIKVSIDTTVASVPHEDVKEHAVQSTSAANPSLQIRSRRKVILKF